MAPDDRGAADPVPADATNRMKFCPNCQSQYPDDANFCPQEGCATGQGPRRPRAPPGSARAPPPALPAGSPAGRLRAAARSSARATARRARPSRTSWSPGVAADDGDAGSGAARAEAAAARAEPPARARARLRQGRRRRLFIASELCDGQPLDQLVANTGPLPLDRAKAIVAQIGEALLEGQKVGVVHHDLSPKNVLVSGSDEVKVINFVAPSPCRRRCSVVAEYLSPEQAEGKLSTSARTRTAWAAS
jgi:serine/threonine-protein kinase